MVPDGRINEPKKRIGLTVIRGEGQTPEDLALDALASPDALERLCDLYIPKIYNFVLKRVGRVEDAEDITSIVFEKVISNLETYDRSRASFSTWIYRIALNSVTDFYRSHGRKKDLPVEDGCLVRVPDGPATEEVELHLILVEAMEKLPEKYQEALALRYFAGMRVLEVAGVLGITESAASKRILRGLDYLRGLVSEGPIEDLFE